MELTIQNWAKEMVAIYTWLTIKYEYSKRYRTFLIDFVYPSQYGNNESFHRAAMAFHDKMCDTYGDDAPLFTNNGKLFSLSENAQVICANSYSVFETLTLAVGLGNFGDWSKSKTTSTSSYVVEGVDAPAYNNLNFEIAA
jgi:hypothetical protein